MKFCPKCGGIMVPRRKDGDLILACMRCGYEMKADRKSLESYAGTSKAEQKARVKTSEISTVSTKGKSMKEELEQAREDYYELVLDQLGEYGE